MPLSWKDLEYAVLTGDTQRIDRRSPSVLAAYQRAPSLSRTEVEEEILQGEDFVLLKNKYPYDVQAYHYVLWCRYPITKAAAYLRVCQLIRGKFLIFENPPSHRSVPHTQHYHVFIPKIS